MASILVPETPLDLVAALTRPPHVTRLFPVMIRTPGGMEREQVWWYAQTQRTPPQSPEQAAGVNVRHRPLLHLAVRG